MRSIATLDAASLRKAVEGVYVLEEWHNDNGTILRPPQVDARLVFVTGNVVFAVRNAVAGITTTGMGSYTIDSAEFAYGYQTWSSVVETASGFSTVKTPPWIGMIKFSAVRTRGGISLTSATGQAIEYTGDSMSYFAGGKLLRVWHRAAAIH